MSPILGLSRLQFEEPAVRQPTVAAPHLCFADALPTLFGGESHAHAAIRVMTDSGVPEVMSLSGGGIR